MTSDLNLDLRELRLALDRVLGAVEKVHGTEVVLGHDFYWSLPAEAAFDMTNAEPVLTTGQLSDDLTSVRQLNDSAEIIAPWHELAHLIGILRAIQALDQP